MQTIEREAKTGVGQREKFTPKDVLKQVVISTLAVSPDGESVVFVKRTVEDGKYARRLWRTTFKGGAPEQLTTGNAGRPRFSPDGKHLAFISDRSGKPQAWVMPTTGGEPKQISDLPSGAGCVDWSPDGTKLLLVGGSGEKRFIVGKADDPTARRIRAYTWRFDGAGIRDEYGSAWIVDAIGGTAKRITAPTYGVDAAAWSPDGKQVAFIADLSETAGLEEVGSIWALPADGGSTNPQMLAQIRGGVYNLIWAPAQLAFVGNGQDGDPGWADIELHLQNGRLAADKNLTVRITSYGVFQDVENMGPPPLAWLDDNNIVALVSHHGRSHPHRFGVDGDVEALATPDAICTAIATGGGRVAVVAAAGEPSDVFAVEKGKLRKLTDDGSKWFGPFKQQPEHLDIKHKDGHSVEAWLLTANGERTKAPLVIDVHGGPNSSFGPTPWLEMNALADAGIHVIWSNPRGSVSYGEKFSRDLEGRWGEPDGSDLLTIIDWAIKEGLTDKDHVGMMGLSYGGFMTSYMIGNHPGVFRAAVTENPVTDFIGEWASSDFGRFIGRRAIQVQNPWEDLDKWVKKSPFAKMHLNHAPLLLLQAENDMRCPPGNSEIVFHILLTLGREVEMIRYPEETHVMLAVGRPDRRVDRLERIVGWFTKHLSP